MQFQGSSVIGLLSSKLKTKISVESKCRICLFFNSKSHPTKKAPSSFSPPSPPFPGRGRLTVNILIGFATQTEGNFVILADTIFVILPLKG